MTVQTLEPAMPWDDAAKDEGTVNVSVTTTLTDTTEYGYNLEGNDWPYGLEVGGMLYGLLVWIDSPAAVDRLIGALHDLKTAVAVKRANADAEALRDEA